MGRLLIAAHGADGDNLTLELARSLAGGGDVSVVLLGSGAAAA